MGGFPLWSSPSILYTWPSTSSNILNVSAVYPGSDQTRSVLIRCVVTNSAGSTASSSVTFTATDDTDCCWLVCATFKAAELTMTPNQKLALFKMHVWGSRHRVNETNVYSTTQGKELIKRIPQHELHNLLPGVMTVLDPKIGSKTRYARLRGLVIQSTRKFWPDCPTLSQID